MRVVVDHVTPRQGRESGQVRVFLDRIAAEIRRQVGHPGLEERGQLRDDGVGGDVQDVRQVVAGDDRRQLDRGVVGLGLDVDVEVDAQFLVDRLPQRVRVHRRGRGAGRPGGDGDVAAAAGRLGDGLDRVGRVVDERRGRSARRRSPGRSALIVVQRDARRQLHAARLGRRRRLGARRRGRRRRRRWCGGRAAGAGAVVAARRAGWLAWRAPPLAARRRRGRARFEDRHGAERHAAGRDADKAAAADLSCGDMVNSTTRASRSARLRPATRTWPT